MNPIIEQLVNQDPSGYREVPEVIRNIVSAREWRYLTDKQRADLIRSETEPEL